MFIRLRNPYNGGLFLINPSHITVVSVNTEDDGIGFSLIDGNVMHAACSMLRFEEALTIAMNAPHRAIVSALMPKPKD